MKRTEVQTTELPKALKRIASRPDLHLLKAVYQEEVDTVFNLGRMVIDTRPHNTQFNDVLELFC